MTDITELAQILKAAAENAIGAHERLAAYPYGEIIDISQHEGEQIDIDITDINEFHEEASPANVLALVEALEKAQQRIDSQREYYEGVIADGGKRIAELESRTVKMPEPFKLAKSSSGLTYYFADDVDAALTDAGIKVEDE